VVDDVWVFARAAMAEVNAVTCRRPLEPARERARGSERTGTIGQLAYVDDGSVVAEGSWLSAQRRGDATHQLTKLRVALAGERPETNLFVAVSLVHAPSLSELAARCLTRPRRKRGDGAFTTAVAYAKGHPVGA